MRRGIYSYNYEFVLVKAGLTIVVFIGTQSLNRQISIWWHFSHLLQFWMHFSKTKGDNLVSGIQPSLLFKTIKCDQLLENSISSSYLLSFFLFLWLFGICWFKQKWSESAMLPCIIVHYPCPHPPRSANTGDTWIPRIYVGKYQEFQGWYTRTVEFLLWTKLRIGAGSPMKQPFEISTTRLTH